MPYQATQAHSDAFLKHLQITPPNLNITSFSKNFSFFSILISEFQFLNGYFSDVLAPDYFFVTCEERYSLRDSLKIFCGRNTRLSRVIGNYRRITLVL
jgi:hypothetical protein